MALLNEVYRKGCVVFLPLTLLRELNVSERTEAECDLLAL